MATAIKPDGPMPRKAEAEKYLTPLVIGVTGHRDLVPSEVAALRKMIAHLFDELRSHFPNTPLRLMTALAEGADRLAAHAANDADVEVQVVLPMPREVYRNDFESPESNAEFDELCVNAEIIELPTKHAGDQAIESPGRDRDIAYANCGMFISAHCHILLALWDGVPSNNLGGTSQIIYFQQYDRLPGVAESVPRSSLFLTDTESDLVYHISCSRYSDPDSGSAVTPLQAKWFTTDPDAPHTEEFPERYIRVFSRTDEYNREIRHLLASDWSRESTEAEPPATSTQAAARRIRDFFDVADILANQFQKKVDRTLVVVHTLAVLTALTFILYSELNGVEPLIFPFLAFLLIGIAIAAFAQRRQWHRKYLDYRVLAEGLRVQYYREIAGIHGEGHTKFAYDNFLRQRDMELGWIRNVMRVAGTLGDAQVASADLTGVEFTIRHWIGEPGHPGQLDYYRQKTSQRARVNRMTETLTHLSLWGGISIGFVLALFLNDLDPKTQDSLIVLMGVLPLIAGVAEVYTQRKADRELTKQYQFMAQVFANASRRLDEAANDTERREVLQGLGDAALSEHAEWILVRRERQPEPASF
jgi:hypothetical protein